MENFEGEKVYKLIHSPNFPYGNNLVISVDSKPPGCSCLHDNVLS